MMRDEERCRQRHWSSSPVYASPLPSLSFPLLSSSSSSLSFSLSSPPPSPPLSRLLSSPLLFSPLHSTPLPVYTVGQLAEGFSKTLCALPRCEVVFMLLCEL